MASRAQTQRVAIALDLENLSHDHRSRGDWAAVRETVWSLLLHTSSRGRLVSGFAVCDANLARRLGPMLGRFGIQTRVHGGGKNAADLALIDCIKHELPSNVDLVMVGSGDKIFVQASTWLEGQGKKVEFVGRRGTMSSRIMSLYPSSFVSRTRVVTLDPQTTAVSA